MGIAPRRSFDRRQVKGGERGYLRVAHRTYHQSIYNLVYRILDDPTDAPDTTQEVFIKVFRGMAKFNGRAV